MASLEAAGTSTEAEDLTWARQRDANVLSAKNILFRAMEQRDGQARVSIELTVE
jgi:hypothetical protein